MSLIIIGEEAYPGPEVRTDAQILEAIQEMVAPVWHTAATCKMGNSEEDGIAKQG